MSRDRSSAELLEIIAGALGVGVETFASLVRRSERDGDTEAAAGHHESLRLYRLIAAYRVLPDDASRVEALRMLERFADRVAGRGRGGASSDPD